MKIRRSGFVGCCVVWLAAMGMAVAAVEYFVALDGCDEGNDGLSREGAFASIQRGVDALAAGDTLTVLPGEYFGAVYRAGLGADDVRTTIRAALPGTVVVRGDKPLQSFQRVPGYRFIYVTEVGFATPVQTVNELDTLTVIEDLPSLAALEFTPGRFFHDVEAGKLYLSTADFASPEGRLYTASITPSQGVNLVDAVNVTLEGLGVTGFNRNEMAPRSDRSQYSTWGIVLVNSRNCIIRECDVWLNGRGIMVNSSAPGSGNNSVEQSRAWANQSQYGTGDFGGMTLFAGRADVIRDSVAFRNHRYGMNIRSEADSPLARDEEGNLIFIEENHSRILSSLAWGNSSAEFKIKTGHEFIHTVEYCVSPGLWSVRPSNVHHSLIGWRSRDYAADNINLADYDDLDPELEFADPLNYDYRLQSTSRFRGTGPGGADPGPFQWQPTVFFLSPDGDDAADGLSIGTAWRTIGRAMESLGAGDTLYLAGGEYAVGDEWKLTTTDPDAMPVSIRGRGTDEVILRGDVAIAGSAPLQFERLTFAGRLSLNGAMNVSVENCVFQAGALVAEGLAGLRVRHCLFNGSPVTLERSKGVHLAGNAYFTGQGPAIIADRYSEVVYSDYNQYPNDRDCWLVAGAPMGFSARGERYSQVAPARAESPVASLAELYDAPVVAAAGPRGTAIGPHSFATEASEDVALGGPWIHSVTATTANIEWAVAGPTHDPDNDSVRAPSVQIRWGTTPEMDQSTNRQTNRFADFSLTGLEPDTEYFLQLTFLRPVKQPRGRLAEPIVERTKRSVTLRFKTAAADPPPRVYYVTPDGDDESDGLSRDRAWQTINHAASEVRPGDTVLIGEGTYTEAVRVRATGDEGRPITFRAAPGERVQIDGVGRTLRYAFLAADKSHLRFDGFYIRGIGHGSPSMPWSDVARGENGAFVLYECHDVHITRCFMDGRGPGSSPGLAHARHCADLLVENNVMLNCMGRLTIYWDSPRTRIRHNVFLRNSITHVAPHIRGSRIQTEQDLCHFERNIVTDNLPVKLHVGLAINAENRDNCFFLRVPPEQRAWHSGEGTTFADMLAALPPGDNTLVADPQFAATVSADMRTSAGDPMPAFDYLIHKRDLDFADLFATNPAVTRHRMGLQPEAFGMLEFNSRHQGQVAIDAAGE